MCTDTWNTSWEIRGNGNIIPKNWDVSTHKSNWCRVSLAGFIVSNFDSWSGRYRRIGRGSGRANEASGTRIKVTRKTYLTEFIHSYSELDAVNNRYITMATLNRCED
jgi:hypothetical protein